jgi:hypothetical protein
MEVRDGFIIGIFNYCDRWCEACAFTSRCRLFADVAEIEASLDPGLKPVVEAPPLPPDLPSPPPRWMEEMLQAMNEAASTIVPTDEDEPPAPQPPQEHLAIEERAARYCMSVFGWLRARDYVAKDPADPLAVIGWFHTMIAAKVHRAVYGLAGDGGEDRRTERDWPSDHDGSAKVALLAIERSHAAWLTLVERGIVTDAEVAFFIDDLVWLGEALEGVFPKARAFVRPGFDEPDEVAMMLARERVKPG